MSGKEEMKHGEEAHSNTQSDDINSPVVATIVAFSAVTLAVTIIALQAWFYNSDEAERVRKTTPQYSMKTQLGQVTAKQTAELHQTGWNDRPGMGEKVRRIDIDAAMDIVVASSAAQK